MNIAIIVATHRQYRMPEDPMYVPVHVGADGKPPLPYIPDNTGDHISAKNATYCELTGLYWAWKNLDADAIGLTHYRRHFVSSFQVSTLFGIEGDWNRLLTHQQAEQLLAQFPVIMPAKRHYWIETVRSHYNHAHRNEDLPALREALPREYHAAFDTVMNRTSVHLFNMFIMRRDVFNTYCEFLFSTLSRMEQQLNISSYSASDARVFGYMGEFMPDIWLEATHTPYTEVPVQFMESQNWLRKGGAFLWRKMRSSRCQ